MKKLILVTIIALITFVSFSNTNITTNQYLDFDDEDYPELINA